MVWQTIPDDRRIIAECPTGERRTMAIEVEDDSSCHSRVDVLLERRAEAGQAGSLACLLSEL